MYSNKLKHINEFRKLGSSTINNKNAVQDVNHLLSCLKIVLFNLFNS